jgi:hypothetical protein
LKRNGSALASLGASCAEEGAVEELGSAPLLGASGVVVALFVESSKLIVSMDRFVYEGSRFAQPEDDPTGFVERRVVATREKDFCI